MPDKTTIRVSRKTKERLASFRLKGETYDALLKRLCKLATEAQLRALLESEEGCITVDEALKRHEKRYGA